MNDLGDSMSVGGCDTEHPCRKAHMMTTMLGGLDVVTDSRVFYAHSEGRRLFKQLREAQISVQI
jgi:hypothetical protein